MNTHENKTEKSKCCGAEKIINLENGWSECSECFEPFLPQQNNGHFESITPLKPKPPISPKAIEDTKEVIREYKEETCICGQFMSSHTEYCSPVQEEQSINSIVVGDTHCLKCHKDFPPIFGKTPHTLECEGEVTDESLTDWEEREREITQLFITELIEKEEIQWEKDFDINYTHSFQTKLGVFVQGFMIKIKPVHVKRFISKLLENQRQAWKMVCQDERDSFDEKVSHAVEEAREESRDCPLPTCLLHNICMEYCDCTPDSIHEELLKQGRTEERERMRKMIEEWIDDTFPSWLDEVEEAGFEPPTDPLLAADHAMKHAKKKAFNLLDNLKQDE